MAHSFPESLMCASGFDPAILKLGESGNLYLRILSSDNIYAVPAKENFTLKVRKTYFVRVSPKMPLFYI
jgi:hypothetical protein